MSATTESAAAVAQRPTLLTWSSRREVLKRTVHRYRRENLSDQAAALTYFGILAIFPGLLALISIMGLLGHSTTQTFLDNLHKFVPGGVNTFLHSAIGNVEGRAGAASIAAVIGILVALWSASGYVAAFMRATNTIYGVGEGRPIWRTAPLRLLVTLTLMVMLIASLVIVVVTGPIARAAGHTLGVGDAAVTAWNIAKWPALVILVSLMFALLYWASPNVRQPGVRWIVPGATLAVVLWLIASGLFGLYLSFSGSYNKTYGPLAGVIIFLVWLWISNTAMLLGFAVNAEMQRQRLLQAGLPPEVTPFADLRDTRKLDDFEQQQVHNARRRRWQAVGRV